MKNTLIILLLVSAFNLSISQNFTAHTDLEGLPDNWVNGLAVDENNNLWAATQSGVGKYDGNSWTVYTSADGILSDDTKCIAIDSSQNIWVGTDYGVSVFNGSSWTSYTETDGLANNTVTFIAADYDGNVWFATYAGLSKFDGTSWETFTTASGMSTDLINYLAFNQSGELWIGTFADGFMKFDGTDFTVYDTSNSLIANNVTGIAFDLSNNIWVSTLYGLSVFDASGNWVRNYTVDDGMYYSMARDILVDDYGHVWAGIYADYVLEGGLSKFNGTNWITYTETNGVTGVIIKRMVKDRNGTIWVATGDGITEIDLSVSVSFNDIDCKNVMWPNPSNDVVYFDIECENITIIDISGKTLSTVSKNSNSISVSNFEKGIYIVKYELDGKILTNKLIVN